MYIPIKSTVTLLALSAIYPTYAAAGEDGEDSEQMETIVVHSTRTGRIANDQPMRVEVINTEEIQEKASMRPGNISMLVAETGGVRVQTTSPALGSANIRLQGMPGRYTQLLADGLPLYGAASIGLLQIPPTDLAQVEIIKGSASSLYGSSALGGMINLISRHPGDTFNGEVLLNATSRQGQDITGYVESPLSNSLKGSITAGAHHQTSQDIDNDGWIDFPQYERYTARPRLFWAGENGATLYSTVGFMTENRSGGTLTNSTVADGSFFPQIQNSQRLDSGLVFSMPVLDSATFNTKASSMMQNHDHLYGDVAEKDRHQSYLLETSLTGYSGNNDWVLGAALQADVYDSDTFPEFDYSYYVPGVFAELDYQINDEITTSYSARVDHHNEYGTQFSPRVSVLYRPSELTIRASYAQGYYAPTPFVEEIEAAGLSRLDALHDLREEQAETASIDFTYAFDKLETSLTLFGSNIDNATKFEAFSTEDSQVLNRVRLVNAVGESRIRGSEVLLRYYLGNLNLTASYLYLDSSETADNGGRQTMSLTPRHSAGFVAMWEEEDSFRAGFEAYYTGTQRLDDNPYLTHSSPYWHLGLMGEMTFGRLSYYINFENLLDIKQSDNQPILLPNRAPSGQWTTDLWSKNEGFTANIGVRMKFGS